MLAAAWRNMQRIAERCAQVHLVLYFVYKLQCNWMISHCAIVVENGCHQRLEKSAGSFGAFKYPARERGTPVRIVFAVHVWVCYPIGLLAQCRCLATLNCLVTKGRSQRAHTIPCKVLGALIVYGQVTLFYSGQ